MAVLDFVYFILFIFFILRKQEIQVPEQPFKMLLDVDEGIPSYVTWPYLALPSFKFPFIFSQSLQLSQPELFKTCRVLLSVPTSHSAFKSPSPFLASKKHLEGSPSLMCIRAITYPTLI